MSENTPENKSTNGARRLWLTGAVAAVAAGAGAGVAWWRSQPQAMGPGVEAQLWSQTFETPDGKPFAMAGLQGRPLLVNFWATWCPPCVRELPLLSRFAQEQPQVQLLGLAVDQAAPVQKFLARQPLAFPVAMAGAGGSTLTRTLGNVTGGLPFSILFDTRGNVKQRKIGELSSADLQQWAQSL